MLLVPPRSTACSHCELLGFVYARLLWVLFFSTSIFGKPDSSRRKRQAETLEENPMKKVKAWEIKRKRSRKVSQSKPEVEELTLWLKFEIVQRASNPTHSSRFSHFWNAYQAHSGFLSSSALVVPHPSLPPTKRSNEKHADKWDSQTNRSQFCFFVIHLLLIQRSATLFYLFKSFQRQDY